VSRGSPDFFPIKPEEFGRFLVISLGTGSSKAEKKYDARVAAKWGVLGWLTEGGSMPIFDVFTQASADMVHFHLSTVFQALHTEKSYLRIQVYIYTSIYSLLLLFMEMEGIYIYIYIYSTMKFKSPSFN
jgi:hypothetical protein